MTGHVLHTFFVETLTATGVRVVQQDDAALNPVDGHCCEPAWAAGDNDIPGIDHDGECRNFDGAPHYYQG